MILIRYQSGNQKVPKGIQKVPKSNQKVPKSNQKVPKGLFEGINGVTRMCQRGKYTVTKG